MRNAIARILLLRAYPEPSNGTGRVMFAFGKCIGIFGRIVVAVFLVGVAIAAVVNQQTLLLTFLAGYPVIGLAVATEVLSSVLMYLGNRVASRAARS